MTVIPISQPAAPLATPKVVRGRGLPARRLSKVQLAVLAAETKEGAAILNDWSNGQLSAVFGVSVTYIAAALKASPVQREAVRRGLRPLIEPHAPASPQERLGKIVAEIGVDGVLNLLGAFEASSSAA
jgi:hypothetical protein